MARNFPQDVDPRKAYDRPLSLKKGNFFQRLLLTEKMEWVAGSPPLAEPKCGFKGEKCISK